MSEQQEPAMGGDQSPTIGKLAEALAAAQGEMSNATKDSENPHFGSAYADLASVRDACVPALSKAKIATVQQVFTSGGEVTVVTKLIHASGEWISCHASVKPERPGAQALGSAVTYLRRYTLAAMTGIAPEDDDGEGAEGRDTRPQRRQPPPRREEPPARRKLDPGGVSTVRRALDKVFPMPKEKGPAADAVSSNRAQLVADVCRRKVDGLGDLFEDEASAVLEAIDKLASQPGDAA